MSALCVTGHWACIGPMSLQGREHAFRPCRKFSPTRFDVSSGDPTPFARQRMKTETPQTIHLKDYTPPAFLIDTVNLDFNIESGGTTVTATLAMRRNPAVAAQPLVLDGDELETLSCCGQRRGSAVFRDADDADHRRPARYVHAAHGRPHRPRPEHPPLRPLPLEGRLLHAMRGAGLPPHHLVRRPPGRDVDLHGDAACRQGGLPGAARQRQPGRYRRRGRRPPLGQMG